MKPIFLSEREAWVGLEIIPIPKPLQPIVARLIAGADIAVCVDPDLHRESFLYLNKRFVCGYCRQLKKDAC